jgi:hypothetical protein
MLPAATEVTTPSVLSIAMVEVRNLNRWPANIDPRVAIGTSDASIAEKDSNFYRDV